MRLIGLRNMPSVRALGNLVVELSIKPDGAVPVTAWENS